MLALIYQHHGSYVQGISRSRNISWNIYLNLGTLVLFGFLWICSCWAAGSSYWGMGLQWGKHGNHKCLDDKKVETLIIRHRRHSYLKLPLYSWYSCFLPIKDGDFQAFFVCSPEAIYHQHPVLTQFPAHRLARSTARSSL